MYLNLYKIQNEDDQDRPIKRMKKNDMTIQEHWSAGTLTTVSHIDGIRCWFT